MQIRLPFRKESLRRSEPSAALAALVLGAAMGTIACAKVILSDPPSTNTPDAAGGDTPVTVTPRDSGARFDSGVRFDADNTPTEDANCGLVPFVLDKAPAPVVLAQDRSTSMRGAVKIGTGTKWENLRAAVRQVVTDTEAHVYWGLKFFPNATTCLISVGPEITPKLMNAAPIVAALDAIPGDVNGLGLTDGTPTRKVLDDARMYLSGLAGTSANKYIVLATDGQPTCLNDNPNDDDYMAALEAGRAVAAAGIKMAVVGIAFKTVAPGDPLPEQLVFLNAMADIGGMARNDPLDPQAHYYPAENTVQLVDAFKAITAQLFTCTFNLPKQPPAEDNVAVKIDGVKVPRDATNGWQYDPGMTSLTLHGGYCDQVKDSMAVIDVKIIFGCAGQVIP